MPENGDAIQYCFKRPHEIPDPVLDQIERLIINGGGVGTSWVRGNLRKAFLVAYALHGDRVVGSSSHKHPKESYKRKIEEAAGLDLSGYLERGYTVVDPDYRSKGIGGTLIRGLIERSEGHKVYVTIRLDNIPPLRMTHREGMVLVGRFTNPRTGHELGVFVNQNKTG